MGQQHCFHFHGAGGGVGTHAVSGVPTVVDSLPGNQHLLGLLQLQGAGPVEHVSRLSNILTFWHRCQLCTVKQGIVVGACFFVLFLLLLLLS